MKDLAIAVPLVAVVLQKGQQLFDVAFTQGSRHVFQLIVVIPVRRKSIVIALRPGGADDKAVTGRFYQIPFQELLNLM